MLIKILVTSEHDSIEKNRRVTEALRGTSICAGQKVLYCSFNPLLAVQYKLYFRKVLPNSGSKIHFHSYIKFFRTLIPSLSAGRMPLVQLLAVIKDGFKLKPLIEELKKYELVVLDQIEHLPELLPYLTELRSASTTLIACVTVPDEHLSNMANSLKTLEDVSVEVMIPNERDTRITDIHDIQELKSEWLRFVSPYNQFSADLPIFPRIAILDFPNERWKRYYSKNIEKLAHRSRMEDVWQYYSPSYPTSISSLCIFNSHQSLGIVYGKALIIHSPGAEEMTEIKSEIRTIFLSETNIKHIVSERHKYRFFLNGREVIIRNWSLGGEKVDWFVEVRSGPAEMRVSPFDLVAEEI